MAPATAQACTPATELCHLLLHRHALMRLNCATCSCTGMHSCHWIQSHRRNRFRKVSKVESDFSRDDSCDAWKSLFIGFLHCKKNPSEMGESNHHMGPWRGGSRVQFCCTVEYFTPSISLCRDDSVTFVVLRITSNAYTNA